MRIAYLATLEELDESDYNFNISRHVDTFEEEEEVNLLAVREKRRQLKTELVDRDIRMDGFLKELRYVE